MTKVDELQTGKSTGRVLLYMRAGEDVSIVRNVLAGMAVEGVVCTDIEDLCRRVVQEDVNGVLLTESALKDGALPPLAEALRRQSQWSDLPVLFVAGGGLESPLAVQAMRELPNVLVLDQPVRLATLTGALQMALRMRTKQRQVRALLHERRQAEEALEQANERLHAQADELTAANEQLLTEREELQRRSLELAQLKDRADRTARTMERLARAVEENPDPALRVGLDGRIRYRNPAAFALCRQWNPEDTFSIPPAVQEIVSAAYARTETIRREMAFGQRVYLITVAPAPPPAKGVNIFVSDLTERKQAEEALRASEERFRAFVIASSDVVYRMSPDWKEMRQLRGREFIPDTDSPSSTWLDKYIDPADQLQVLAVIEEAIRTKSIFALEHRVRRVDGTLGWTFSRAVPLLDANGEIVEWFGTASDITERKHAEEALRESEERLHLALGAARMGAWQWEVGTQHVVWSPELYGLLGYEPGAVTPSHEAFHQRIHPEDLARWEEAMRESIELCEDYTCEFRVVWADGSVHWVEARGEYAYPRDGSATQAVWIRGVLSDIEQRKQAEEALRRSEEQFHRLFDDDLTGNFICTPEGTIRLCNPAFAAIFGFSRAGEAVGTSMADLYIDPTERAALLERLRKEGKTERLEVWRRRRDGTPIHIVENLVGHFDEQGELYEIKGYIFEDTQRKRAEMDLRESQKQFRTMANAIPQLAWIARADGYIYWYNQRWYEYTGTTPAQMEGWGWQSVHDPQELPKVLERWKSSIVTGRPFDMTFPLRGADGIFRPFLTRVMPLKDEQGRIRQWFGTNTDVSEQKRAEEALRGLNVTLESKVTQRTAELRHRTRQLQKLTLEMSEAEERERERLAHILHEDLQQELAAAKFHLSLARSRISSDTAAQEMIATAVELLKDAIGKSRSLSHELSPIVLHRGDFAEALQWLAGQMQAQHGLAVRVHGQARLPSDGIKAFLFRTAQELLFNAVKHAQVREARVRIRLCGGYVCLSVSDRGRGFDPAQLRETAGFGLLSIRERIELLGGRMKIRSAPGRGSTLFVVVPGDERTRRLAGCAAGVPPAAEREGRLRVLLADDHEVVRQGLTALLGEEETVEVVGEAVNGREAVELAERLHPDVVLMDVSMPVMSGEEAARQIKRDLPRTRIVSLTMREEPEVRERMQQAGADSYILKTAPYKELLAAIRGPNRSPSDLPYESAA